MRSHSIFEQLESLDVEQLNEIREALREIQVGAFGPEERNHRSLNDIDVFKKAIQLKKGTNESATALEQVLPGILPLVDNLEKLTTVIASTPGSLRKRIKRREISVGDATREKIFLKPDENGNPRDMVIAGDELLPVTVCFVKSQLESDVQRMQDCQKKIELIADIIVGIDGGSSYAFTLTNFNAAIEAAIIEVEQEKAAAEQEGVAEQKVEPEQSVSKESELYSLLAQEAILVSRSQLQENRQLGNDLMGELAFFIDEAELNKLKETIQSYQKEEMATLCKLLDKAGIPDAYQRDAYLGNRGNKIVDDENVQLKSMKEIIGQFEFGGNVVFRGKLLEPKYSDLKKVVDKCRLFVEAEDILTDTKQLAQNRIQRLKEHFTSTDAEAKIEKHRRFAILDYIAAFFTFGIKGGRAKSKLVVKKEVLPEIARLNHFFKRDRSPSSPQDAGSDQKRQRINTIDLVDDVKLIPEANSEAKPVARPRSQSEADAAKSHEEQTPVIRRGRGRANSA